LNHFPHAYLSTNKRTIPISLVHIFVAIARRLGIAASPVDFPARVLAHVSSLDPAVDDIYVDVFGSQSKPILSARDDIPLMLLRAGISPQSMMQYISPGNGSPMLLRAARNIFASHHSLVNVPEMVSKPSIYAALCVHVLLTSDARLVSYMMSHIDVRPLDCATFLSDILAPALGPRCREVLEESCRSILMNEAEAASVVNLRSKSNIQLKFFVGLIFEHRIYGYIGCIIGWEVWILFFLSYMS
jgi:F-box protein 21